MSSSERSFWYLLGWAAVAIPTVIVWMLLVQYNVIPYFGVPNDTAKGIMIHIGIGITIGTALYALLMGGMIGFEDLIWWLWP